jgi:hypothetical protein
MNHMTACTYCFSTHGHHVNCPRFQTTVAGRRIPIDLHSARQEESDAALPAVVQPDA